MSQTTRSPIGPEDVITVKGQYLFQGDSNNRFFVKGIAFPIPPPAPAKLDIDGWIAVLEQLANDTDVNAVRVYDMDCYHVNDTYDRFLKRAAELGIYVIVPLTSSSGDGNLMRDENPPDCYPKKLFQYGKTCIDNYWDRPNVIMGVIGNEVMNSKMTYKSAPCVKSYLNDLSKYSRAVSKHSSSNRKSFPLMYSTQHDSPTSAIQPDEAIKLTLDYLSCRPKTANGLMDLDFVFGINIESWCSSTESFDFEDDGVTESSYHSLWRTFSIKNSTVKVMDAVSGDITLKEVPPVSPVPVTVPVIFSEMGCSREDFNRDNPLVPPDQKHIRDWRQVALVSSDDGPMADLWSGFVAYGYDGGGFNGFRIMGGGDTIKWNGKDPLPPSMEYYNFRDELSKVGKQSVPELSHASRALTTMDESMLSCEFAVDKIREYFDLELYSLSKMHSHYSEGIFSNFDIPHFRAPPSSEPPTVAMIRTDSTSEAGITSANAHVPLVFSMLLLLVLVAGIFVAGKKRIGEAKTLVDDFVENFRETKGASKSGAQDPIQSNIANYGAI